jgi:hypothetical protein
VSDDSRPSDAPHHREFSHDFFADRRICDSGAAGSQMHARDMTDSSPPSLANLGRPALTSAGGWLYNPAIKQGSVIRDSCQKPTVGLRKLAGIEYHGAMFPPVAGFRAIIGTYGATECSHGWSVARAQPRDAEPVETRSIFISPPRQGRRSAPMQDRPQDSRNTSAAAAGRKCVLRQRIHGLSLRSARGYSPLPRWGQKDRSVVVLSPCRRNAHFSLPR